MFQKIKSRIKTEGIPWIRHHWLLVTVSVILAFSPPLIVGIIFLYGLVATIEVEMLKAMIQAEVTILGFYGLIVVYALTSLDNRMDRLEQQRFDLTKEGRKTNELREVLQEHVSQERYNKLSETLHNIEKTKRKTVYSALYNGALLIGSLLASILGLGFLGIPNNEWAFYMCSFSAMLFFFGIGLILLMVYDLAQNLETPRE
jgi:hypothetical protein